MSDNPAFPNLIKFSDDFETYELQLQDGARGITEGSSSASTLGNTTGGGKYGDMEPNFSHIEQRTWSGGRGIENLVDDATRFFDSQNLMSSTPNRLYPAPKWRWAHGLKIEDYRESDSIGFDPLFSKASGRYRCFYFNAAQSYNAAQIELWIRRRGTPGTLTLELCADGTNKPGTVLKTVTKTVTNIPDTVSRLITFTFPSVQALVATTKYYVKLTSAATDDLASHWEIGTNNTTGIFDSVSINGTIWTNGASKSTVFRVTEASIDRKWLDFDLEGAKYIVSVMANGTASDVYINGDRGTATSGSTTTLVNTARTWVASRWVGAMVKCIKGTGIGQSAVITANTTTQLSFAAVPIAFDNTSRYVIYKTPWWTQASIGTHGLGTVKSVTVIDSIAYFAQGPGAVIRLMRNNASTHDWAADATGYGADLVYGFYDQTAGAQLWRAKNNSTKYSSVSRATVVAWGSNLVFGSDIAVGSENCAITGMCSYNNQLWVTKEDGLWNIQNNRAVEVNIGIKGLPDPKNGTVIAADSMFLYFNFWKSFERLYGGTVDDVGPWHDAGLPSGRNGTVCAIVPLLAYMFIAIEAAQNTTTGEGMSSVFLYMNRGFHEVYRAPGERIRGAFAQANYDTNPYLWIDSGGELSYQEYALVPLQESGYAYQHEAVLVSPTIDMGHSDTYKFFEQIAIDSENLGNLTARNRSGSIGVDYQAGSDVGTSTWIPLSVLYSTPKDSSFIGKGETTKIRYRLRMMTSAATIPPIINAIVIKGFEVLPAKRVWNLRVKVSSLLAGRRHVDPDAFYMWLWEASTKARRVTMTTNIPNIESVYIKLEPPSTSWAFINRAAKWTGSFHLTVREL